MKTKEYLWEDQDRMRKVLMVLDYFWEPYDPPSAHSPAYGGFNVIEGWNVKQAWQITDDGDEIEIVLTDEDKSAINADFDLYLNSHTVSISEFCETN